MSQVQVDGFPPQASMVRRTDVVFRARYPQVVTRIFEVAPHHYQIVFDEAYLSAREVEEHFRRTIRPASCAIELSNALPSKFLREIEPIRDCEVARGFEGLPFSFRDIKYLLLGKFPDLPRISMAGHENNPITLVLEADLTSERKLEVMRVLNGLLPGWPFALVTDPSASFEEDFTHEDILRFRPSALRKGVPDFVREDERFWYENLDRIFEGGLSTSQVPGVEGAGYSCFIDASAFPQIDLRQAVLLYDTIFLAPPLSGGTFWEEQSLQQRDLLKLVEAGRLRLVLMQPEERTDCEFLAAAHERDGSAVIGRMSAAAVVAADVVQTANEYTFAKPSLTRQIVSLVRTLAAEINLPEELIIRTLLWPMSARRACLRPLMDRGLLGLAGFGLGAVLADELKIVLGKDYELEALSTSEGVHIAHALGATLIPPIREMEGWLAPRNIVGDRLNFYRGMNDRIAAAWAANERRKEEKRTIIPPLPLFEFEPYAPIDDIISITAKASTRRGGRAMVSRLADLPIEEREAEVERLGQEFYKYGARKSRRQLWLDAGSDAIDVAAAGMSASLFPAKALWNLLGIGVSLARKLPALDALVEALEADFREKTGQNGDLDFLSKVSRVAELREPLHS